MLIDLQLHSTYSDGYLTPTELVKFISAQGVKAASLTDHNTVGGLDEFKIACEKYNIKPITGLELYIKLDGKRFNVLWYNFDNNSPELHKILRNSQIRRRGQVRKILEQLKKQKFKIKIDKILDKYTHYTPINHIIDDICSAPANLIKIKKELDNKNPQEGEIIHKYFRNHEIGILRESYIDITRIFELRKKIGGQIILCHPAKYSYIKYDNWKKLKKMGLDGAEILSPHHSIGAVMYSQYLARKLNFIQTGGSDFHRRERGKTNIKNCYDYFKIDSKYLKGIKKIIGQHYEK